MGCWNETCYITNLPIFCGEPVVVIPLMKLRDGIDRPHPCEVADNFMPIAFPVFGKYNDYGGIKDSVTSSANASHLYNMVFYTKNGATQEYEPVLVESTLDDFINETFCSSDTVYVEVQNNYFFPDGKAPVTFMMMHTGAYMTVMNEIAERVPYERDVNYRSVLEKHCKKEYHKIIQHSTFPIHKCDTVALEAEKLKELEVLNRIDRIRQISDVIFGLAFRFHKTIWNDFSECIIDSPQYLDEIISDVVNLVIFATALSYMRKGFLVNTGRGSQDCETRLQVLIAKFICEHVKENEDCEVTGDENGVIQPIYFYE